MLSLSLTRVSRTDLLTHPLVDNETFAVTGMKMPFIGGGFDSFVGLVLIMFEITRDARQMDENNIHNQHNIVAFLIKYAKLNNHIPNVR